MTKITPVFSDNSMTVLCKRYLMPKTDGRLACPKCGKCHETPEEMLERVTFGNEDYYNLLASLDFLPNSPTLFNMGTGQGTSSGCFKFDVPDSMTGILETARKAALVQKFGGGVGYCLSDLRPKGTLIKSTHGKACGPIAVLEYYHAGSRMITQGGKREGAQMAVLSCYHGDIKEFIHCKDDGKTLSTFNLSVACTDEFMSRVQIEGSEESKLFDEIVKSSWTTGDPGLYFIDTAEKANPTPWLGKLTGTNPCGEVPLLDNEPCNLGSINLSHCVTKDRKFNFDKLEVVTKLATRYLDEVLDHNSFPDDSITKMALLTRKLGLGVMGWADALALLHIPYNSEAAIDLGAQVMRTIQNYSHKESVLLGKEKGVCPAYQNRGDLHSQERNAVTTCIAPAGTIAVLAGCSSGIEPHYTLSGTRVMGDGTKLIEKLEVLDQIGDFIPRTAHEIDWEWHIKHQSVFQSYTDLAVSKTINLSENTTESEIREALLYAWKLKCIGITVYRDKSRVSQVLTDKTDTKEVYPVDIGSRRKLSRERDAKVYKFDLGDLEGYLHIGLYEDGTPGEVFITSSKQGSTISGLLDGFAIVTSIAIQYGVPLEVLTSKLIGTRFEPAGLTKDNRIPVATSLFDYIFRYLKMKFLNGREVSTESSGMLCPECGSSTILEEGCQRCSNKSCTWSRCG